MRAIWFEIPVTDMERARKFYQAIFKEDMGEPFDMNGSLMSFFPYDEHEGATGTLIQHEAYTTSHAGAQIYLAVPEINDVLERVESAGGKIINEKSSIGEHGFVAHFEDAEGNRIGLHQNAK